MTLFKALVLAGALTAAAGCKKKTATDPNVPPAGATAGTTPAAGEANVGTQTGSNGTSGTPGVTGATGTGTPSASPTAGSTGTMGSAAGSAVGGVGSSAGSARMH